MNDDSPGPSDEAAKLTTLVNERLASLSRALEHDEDWKTWLAIGAAERALAGDHEDRYWLELAQNARDALHEGGGGRAWFGVTESGVVVANDGSPFRLWDPAVLDAVCLLGRSTKADKAGYVGHKGIGLKSIILRSAGYAVRSRSDAGEIHRLGFLRSKTWGFVETELSRLRTNGPDWEGIVRARFADRAAIPLFRAPHMIAESAGHDCDLLEDLLEDGSPKRNEAEGLSAEGERTPLPGFRTAVHLPFGDGAWQLPARDVGDPADEAWAHLMELTPEVLITLGEFREVHLVRIRAGSIVGALRFDFGRKDDVALGSGETGYRRAVIRVGVQRFGDVGPLAEGAGEHDYLEFSAPFEVARDDGKPGKTDSSPIRALVRVPADADSPRGPDRPLALFYPIEHATAGLPFVLHAPFVVTPNRKELRQAAQNATIFKHAGGLILAAAEYAAAPSSLLAPFMPWAMTPTRGPKSRSVQLEAFVEGLLDSLRRTACVPTAAEGAAQGGDLLFDPARPRAFALLGERLPALQPSASCISGFERMVEAAGPIASVRAAAVGLGGLLADRGRAVATADQLVKAFADDEGMTIVADARAARVWVRTIAAWIRGCEDVGPSVADALGRGRLPLIPAAGDVGEGTRLVRLEVQARTEAGTQFLRRARVLLWRNRDDKDDISTLPAPPSSLPVFLADEQLANDEQVVGMLTHYGKRWGARRLERARTLAEEVADRLADAAPESTELVGYLAALVDLLGRSAWPVAPYAGIDPQQIHLAVSEGTPNARDDLTFARRLGRVLLPTAAKGWAGGGDLAFGLPWAAEIDGVDLTGGENGSATAGARWGRAVREMAVARALLRSPAPLIAGPDDDVWLPALAMLTRLGTTAPRRALARLLISLGVAPGPVLQLRWAHWSDAGGDVPGAVAPAVARAWSAGRVAGLPDALAKSLLDWRRIAWSSRHHPSLTTWHSRACPGGPGAQLRPPPNRGGDNYAVALTWTWSAELLEVEDPAAAAAIRAVLTELLPELEPPLNSSWGCKGYHGIGQHFQAIPSLLRVQLEQTPMWPGWTRHATSPAARPASALIYANESLGDAATSQTGWLARVHAPENGVDPLRALASALGILPANELPAHKAWALLSDHIERSMTAPPPDGAMVVELPQLSGRTQWVGATNLLLRRLLDAMPGVADSVRFEWCARDLALRPGWLLATRGDAYVAVRVSAVKGSQVATLRAPVSNYREQPPVGLVRNELVLVVDRGDRPRFATLVAALGTPETPQPAAPAFAGRLDESPEAAALVTQLRAALELRLPELIGVLALRRGDPSGDARPLLDRIERLRIHRDAGLRPPSGLTSGDQPGLVASREALDAAEHGGRSLGATLARGIAFAVGAPTYEHTFRWALTEDVDEVRASLRDQDVRVEELIASVSELAAAKLARETAIGAAFDEVVPQVLHANAALREDVVGGLDGSTAALVWLRAVLAAGAEALVDVTGPLRAYVGSLLPTRGVLNNLVGAGDAACSEALVRLASLETLARLGAELSSVITPSNAAGVFRAGLDTLLRTDWWEGHAFLCAKLDEDAVREPPSAPAVTWTAREWGTLAEAACTAVEELWMAAGRPAWLRILVDSVDASAIEDALAVGATIAKRRSESRTAAWLTTALPGEAAETSASSGVLSGSRPDPTGRGGGGAGSGGDPVRGEAGELACLRWLWQRFVALPAAERIELMTAVVQRREASGVAWSTNAGAARARKLEKEHAMALSAATEADILDLVEPFRAIFDVSTERGPGFDLIEWDGERGAPGWPTLKRVEIKAVESAASLAFRFTTNEFHRARMDGQTYVLRLVEVPNADQPVARVVREVRDPVAELGMEKLMLDCVRSGEANFRLK
jgi:hypothetical protein